MGIARTVIRAQLDQQLRERERQQNQEQNTALFSALGGDALANPELAQQAQSLVTLPTNEAVAGLEALLQRGQRRSPTFQQQRVAAEAEAKRQADQPIIGRLNQRYLTQIRSPVNVVDALAQLEGALQTGSSVGAVAAVVKLAKILDPDSVVREGEVRTVEGGLGIADQLINVMNRVEGEGFGADAANDILEVAKAMAAPIVERGRRIESEFDMMAKAANVDFNQVTAGAGFLIESLPQPGVGGVWGVPDVDIDLTR